LEERLRRIKGKFILSLNDLPEVRKLFGKFDISKTGLPYGAQRNARKRFTEIIIRNF
jgi:DNA adenine methylase